MIFVMKVEKAPLELYADIGGLDETVELLNYIMVGENKGKEGKPPRLDLGYERNSTHKYGNKRRRKKNNTKEIWIVSWKWKKRKEKASDIWEKKYSREYTTKLACIIRNPFPLSKSTKAHSMQPPKDDYSDLDSKPLNWTFLVNILRERFYFDSWLCL